MTSQTPVWREDPGLSGQFHPEYPDDLQVIVHDGEPRRTGHGPEGCWVRIIAAEPSIQRTVIYEQGSSPLSQQEFAARYNTRSPIYVGKLLNAPHALTTVKEGELIRFLVVPGLPHPLHVTSDYLRERPKWGVVPCDKCGASECLDPPTVMAATRFPGMPPDQAPVQFTAFCALCGGVQILSNLEHSEEEGEEEEDEPAGSPPAPTQKPWWKFW